MQNVTLPIAAIVLIAIGTYPAIYLIVKGIKRAPGDLREFASKVWSTIS